MSKKVKTDVKTKSKTRMPPDIECPECQSKNIIAHTNDELRKYHLLVWQCFDCDNFWQTGWDIGMPPRIDVIKHCKKYAKQIKVFKDIERKSASKV